jgi:hypothetical protein
LQRSTKKKESSETNVVSDTVWVKAAPQ